MNISLMDIYMHKHKNLGCPFNRMSQECNDKLILRLLTIAPKLYCHNEEGYR